MAIKDQTMTTGVDENGNEFVSELNATYTETLADGTQIEADITTTADADDPTQVESHMTVTETAPDGTETVTEVVANEDGTFIVEEESALENFVENALGVQINDNLTPITLDGETSSDSETDIYQAEFDAVQDETDVFETESDFETIGSDFTVGEEMFDSTLSPLETGEVSDAEAPLDSTFDATDTGYTATPLVDSSIDSAVETTGTTDAYSTEVSEAEAAEIAEQEVHAQAAQDAQAAADEFIAEGDYAAAAEARETAENAAWEAGDDSMLSAYDAQDLTTAAEKQEEAEYYNAQQAEFAQAGDYEAASEAATNAGYATGDADLLAGGDDHTGQADAERYNMDNAVWQEGIAQDDLENAEYYAEAGNFEAAEASLDSAAAHQASADYFGDLGEHGGEMAVYDPSSEVASGGTYDTTYDAGIADVDTGFDTSVDTTVDTSYDSGTDTY